MSTTQAKRVALYARVSTQDQDTNAQLTTLREAAKRAGWRITGSYVDNGVSGTKAGAARPEFTRMMADAVAGKFDVIAAWSVDRLGRSLQQLVGFLSEIHEHKIDLYLHQQGIDTTTPGGKAMFQLMGVFAEFERAMIVERTKAGVEQARKAGKTLGRPQVTEEMEAEIGQLLTDGIGVREIRRRTGIGYSAIYRIRDERNLHTGRKPAKPPVSL